VTSYKTFIEMSIEINWNRTGALSPNDPNSFSNPGKLTFLVQILDNFDPCISYPDFAFIESIRVHSMHIKWDVDFKVKQLRGSVRYDLVRSDAGVTIVVSLSNFLFSLVLQLCHA